MKTGVGTIIVAIQIIVTVMIGSSRTIAETIIAAIQVDTNTLVTTSDSVHMIKHVCRVKTVIDVKILLINQLT